MKNKSKILIVGGSNAGLSSALRVRELDSYITPTVVLADEYPNFSICGIPFYLSHEVPDYCHLAHRTRSEIEALGVDVCTSTRAIAIDPKFKTCRLLLPNHSQQEVQYDKLIIGTGAEPIKPGITGLNQPGVFTLRWIDEARAINRYIDEHRVRSVVLVGAGCLNLELANALTKRGLQETLVERNPAVLKTVDTELGRIVEEQLTTEEVNVFPRQQVDTITRHSDRLVVSLASGKELSAELVMLAAGARPETTLARSRGVEIGEGDAIKVNQRMETNVEDIYAAGDCAETFHRLLGRSTYLPLGSTSHKQGRVAGENAIGGSRQFHGTVGTQVVKVFDLVVARTGLKDDDGRGFGYDPVTVAGEYWDHKGIILVQREC